MSGTTVSEASRHGLAIRPSANGGWALLRRGRRLFESNLRERVEGALEQDLAKVAGFEELRGLLATLDEKAGAAAPARPRTSLGPARPMAEQRSSALHEAAHVVAAWSLGHPVSEVWIHQAGPRIRRDGGVLEGHTISDWPIRSDEDRGDAVVVVLAGPVLNATDAGASSDDLEDYPERFGGKDDWPEAIRLMRVGGPRFVRSLTGEDHPGDRNLLGNHGVPDVAVARPSEGASARRGAGRRAPRRRVVRSNDLVADRIRLPGRAAELGRPAGMVTPEGMVRIRTNFRLWADGRWDRAGPRGRRVAGIRGTRHLRGLGGPRS